MNLAIILSYSWLGCLLLFTLVLAFYKKNYVTIYNKRRSLIFVVECCLQVWCLVVAGMVLSRSIAYTSVIGVLMWYFTYYEGDLVMSAVLSNIHESLSSLFVIFMAHAADSFIGKFRTLLFSTTAYIGGLLLLWMFNPYDVTWLLVVILFLLALGTSGDNVLYDLITDLVDDGKNSQDWSKEQSLLHATVIWNVVSVIGAISATLWVVHDSIGGTYASWRTSFLICIIAIAAGLIHFCTGHNRYRQGPLTKRPVEIFLRVFLSHIQKLFNYNQWYTKNTLRQDGSTHNFDHTERGDDEEMRSPISLDIKGKEEGGRGMSYTQEDMEVVKSLLDMFPMWLTFFAVSLVSATGSTFFLEQYNNLNTDNDIAIQIYSMIQSLSAFVIPFLYRWICRSRKNEKVKIGVGMLCGIICCVFAWRLEVHRLKEVQKLVNKDDNTSISFLWLVPQFCVLGFMEGLTGDGLLKFYKSQIKKEPIDSYGEEYIEVVKCLGKLVNIVLILILKRKLGWFSYTINDSRVDKYYLFLVCVGSVNLILYCCIAKSFYNHTEAPQASGDDNLDHAEDVICELQTTIQGFNEESS